MNRFLATPRLADAVGCVLRCTCGVLGCAAVAGALSLGAPASAAAVERVEPGPHRSMPVTCRRPAAVTDWHTLRTCKEAWLAMHQRSRNEPPGRRQIPAARGGRAERPGKGRPQVRKPTETPGVRPTTTASPREVVPSPTASPPPVLSPENAEREPSAGSLQSTILLSILLSAAAAICYPFRHRICAAVTAGGTAPPAAAGGGEIGARTVPLTYRSAPDPFVVPVLALSGAGAVAAARMLALSALEEHGDTALVIIPRPDATALFGLSEDELLDESAAGLFIPGNLDAALAYLETELAIRRNTASPRVRRLLLVADCEKESARIGELLARHPSGATMILLGAWAGEQAAVDDDGRVDAPPALTALLPRRLPAMSRTEARDRLHAALERPGQESNRPVKRRSGTRRP